MKILNLFTFSLLLCFQSFAQDNLLESISETETTEIGSGFKGTRLVLLHTTKMRAKKEFDFIFQHRFGPISSGSYELFGLDQAFVRLGVAYAFTDNLTLGLGRSSADKTYDLFIKGRLMKQSESKPVSVVLLGSTAVKTSPKSSDAPELTFNDRLSYVVMGLFSRKFNDHLTLQLSPSWVYKNLVDPTENNNSTIALGVGGRYAISKRVSLTAEYFYRGNLPSTTSTKNPVSFGVDIETGGHVFQLHLTNSLYSFERGVLTEVQDDFFNGDIRLGFNVSRTFQF